MSTDTSTPPSFRGPPPWLVGVTLPIALLLIPVVHGHYSQLASEVEIAAQRETAKLEAAARAEAAKLEVTAQREAEQRRHYLGVAVGILSEKEDPKAPLKTWAVDVLAQYSPVPLTGATLAALQSGEAVLAYKPLDGPSVYVPDYTYSTSGASYGGYSTGSADVLKEKKPQ